MHKTILGVVVATLSAGCGGDGDSKATPLSVPDGCNPIAYEHDCLLPFPTDYFRGAEGVVLPDAAKIATNKGELAEPLTLHPAAGFSPGTQILALFPQGIDDAPLVGATDELTRSLDDDSPTLLIDAASGERVMHLAEVDPRANDDTRRGLVIRPLTRLEDGARYLVAIRDLRDRDGGAIEAPAGFARLRDGIDSGSDAIEGLRDHYEQDVFAPLEAAGVARGALQLAWDFTVRSSEDGAGDMLRVRDLTVAWLERTTPAVEVVGVEDAPDPHTFRRIELRMDVPLYMQADAPLALLARDGDGRVSANGMHEVDFTVWIPQSVANRQPGDPPARLMQFGHGFFGGRVEVDSFIVELADELGLVVVATDWVGMSKEDRNPLAESLAGSLSQGLVFTDRVHQAMANFMSVAHVAQHGLLDLPELAIGPAPMYDASRLYFYGISQGGILGGSYLGLSPAVDRGVLGVGGCDFSFMMFRARPFLAFLAVISFGTPDYLDQQKFALLSQTTFDRIDPLTYAPRVDVPVLLQIGLGDDQVPNLASHLHARALGAELIAPAARPIAGLEESAGPSERALVEFDFGIDPLPGELAVPPTTENEAHEGVRRLAAAKEQLDRFFRPGGMIEHTCDGVCDPE